MDFMAKNRLPAVYQLSEHVRAGGLMSYGASQPDLFRRAAGYVHKICKAPNPPTYRWSSRSNSSWPLTSRPPRRSALRYRPGFLPAPTSGSIEAAQIHHAARRRGGNVAARGARTARRTDAAHRRAPTVFRRRCGVAGPHGGILADSGIIGLDHRPQPADRHSLGWNQWRRHPQTRSRIGRAHAGRHPRPWRLDRPAATAGDPQRADRLSGRRRSSRRRHRRQSGATGWQHHRFHDFRIQHGGKWLELLKEIAPDVTRVAVLRDPTNSAAIAQFGVIQAMALPLRVEVSPIDVRDAVEIERAVTAFARSAHGGLIAT